MTLTASLADRLGLGVAARRLNYHTGMLLDAEDLRSEQTYHRSRLARALATLHGHGTIAGLAVGTLDHDGELHITISPGLAIDRLGRLIELAETHCLRLDRWLEEIRLGPNGRTELEDAFSTGALTADVFIAYSECEQGLRPALPQANVDALDAAVPGMLAESGRCELVLRQEPDPELHLPRQQVVLLAAQITRGEEAAVEPQGAPPPLVDDQGAGLLLATGLLPFELHALGTDGGIEHGNHLVRPASQASSAAL